MGLSRNKGGGQPDECQVLQLTLLLGFYVTDEELEMKRVYIVISRCNCCFLGGGREGTIHQQVMCCRQHDSDYGFWFGTLCSWRNDFDHSAVIVEIFRKISNLEHIFPWLKPQMYRPKSNCGMQKPLDISGQKYFIYVQCFVSLLHYYVSQEIH